MAIRSDWHVVCRFDEAPSTTARDCCNEAESRSKELTSQMLVSVQTQREVYVQARELLVSACRSAASLGARLAHLERTWDLWHSSNPRASLILLVRQASLLAGQVDQH